jgi:hypothetical protein
MHCPVYGRRTDDTLHARVELLNSVVPHGQSIFVYFCGCGALAKEVTKLRLLTPPCPCGDPESHGCDYEGYPQFPGKQR